ncbi:MAG: SagB family peptide dehydrogenase [Myxococcaceae bacterium]|nr:SagB family peptide dehydrogenase [Myxococcaceae bacterium]
MSTRETLSLVRGVTLAPAAEGRRALAGRIRLMLPPTSPGVGAALDALGAGGHSLEELSELAGRDGLTHAAIFQSLLGALRAHGALARLLHLEGVAIAALSPEGSSLARGSPRASTRYQLSRFAFTRVADGGTLLEVPLSKPSVWMPTWHGPALLGALATPRLPAELGAAVPGIPEDAAVAFLGMLQEAGALAEVDPEGVAVEPEALTTWEFHDLLFHGWTRWGRQERGYGGATFRFRDRLPEPAKKPAPPGSAIALAVPDLARAERSDPPLTAVLERRRSVRAHGSRPLTRDELGELLYRAVGLRRAALERRGETEARPYPSGGAIYETAVYVIAHRCEGLETGLYSYRPEDHSLYHVAPRSPELEGLLKLAAAGAMISEPPQVLLVLTARFARMAWKYETVAYTNMLKHVGVIFQTLYLVATAMGLAPCALGGGGADLFARAAGLDPLVEGSVGEFILGTRPEPAAPERQGEAPAAAKGS